MASVCVGGEEDNIMTTVQLFYDSNSWIDRYRVSAVSYVDNYYSIIIIIHVHVH